MSTVKRAGRDLAVEIVKELHRWLQESDGTALPTASALFGDVDGLTLGDAVEQTIAMLSGVAPKGNVIGQVAYPDHEGFMPIPRGTKGFVNFGGADVVHMAHDTYPDNDDGWPICGVMSTRPLNHVEISTRPRPICIGCLKKHKEMRNGQPS